MLAIRIQLNKRNIVLHEDSSEYELGVRLKNGEYRYLPWSGFADIELAKRAGTSVKCRVNAYTLNYEARARWIECDHLQGCLVSMGASLLPKVFVVTRNGIPVDISRRMQRW